MPRLSPQRVLNVSLILVFVFLVLPLYLDKGISDSLDHARGTGTVGGIDFKAYYIAADMLRNGEDFYNVALQTSEVLARGLPLNESFYIYPPLLAICFVPLAALPMQTAAQVWFFINLGLYGLALVLLARSLQLRRVSRMLPLFWILAFLFPPVLFTLYKGQVNIIILLLLAMAYWLYRRGLPSVAGLPLGVAAMIKIMPVLLVLYFLWKRKYALSAVAVCTMVIISIFGVAVVGLAPHETYLREVLPSLAQPRPNPANQSLGGFLSLVLIENTYTDNLVHSPFLWKALTFMLSAALVGATAAISARQRDGEERLQLEISLVIATMPLIATISWVDMFVLLVFPYAVLLGYFLRARRKDFLARGDERPSTHPPLLNTLLACACLSVLLVSTPRLLELLSSLGGRGVWLLSNPLFLGLPFYGTAILWLSLACLLVNMEDPSVSKHAKAKPR